LGLGMVEQLGESYAAQFAWLTVIGAGIVDNRGLRAGTGDDHGVPGGGLAELAVEEQVSGLGLVDVAGEEVCVALGQGFGVGKLGEGAVCGIGRLEAAGTDAEEGCAERRDWVMPGVDLAGKSGDLDAGGEEPGIVVPFKGFAVGVAQEAGAVGDFGWNFRFGTNGLVVGDEREPLAEGGLIGWVG